MAHYVSQPGSAAIMPAQRLTYRQIADDITAKIAAGEPGYQPGDQLPSTDQLAALYSVHRSTIVRAVGILHERRVIRGYQGLGMFVAE